MKLARLAAFFSDSPAARLLRSPHAAQIVFFLQSQFKNAAAATHPHSRLVQQLADFLATVRATHPDRLADDPETYLAHWSAGNCRWLRRFHDATHTEPVYELTPHSEQVLKFLRDVLDHDLGFVGTESRLKYVLNAFSDIVVRSSDDPDRRLEHLHAQQDHIRQEIEAIESGAPVETYGPTALRERFAQAVSDLGSLLADFRAVEESFRQITRDVQERQSGADGSRGEILQFALDAEENLKTSDEGVSFDEFMRLVLSPHQQEEVEAIAAQLEKIELLAGEVEGMRHVRAMMGNLSSEAEKVLHTTRRLSATLRRVLDTQTSARRLRLTQVLHEIKAAAARSAHQTPPPDIGIELEAELDLGCPAERTFWSPPTRFDTSPLQDHQPDEDDRLVAFRSFAALEQLDWGELQRNIAAMFNEGAPRVSLGQLLARHPLSSGPLEVLGYIQLAHEGGHHVDPSRTEVVCLGSHAAEAGTYEVPQVTFLCHRLRQPQTSLPAGDVGP